MSSDGTDRCEDVVAGTYRSLGPRAGAIEEDDIPGVRGAFEYRGPVLLKSDEAEGMTMPRGQLGSRLKLAPLSSLSVHSAIAVTQPGPALSTSTRPECKQARPTD